jgi:hypothetical protein
MMLTTLTLNRPARVQSCPVRLDAEYRAARWAHHRLLDFEDEHQRHLDEVAEAVAPGIVRVGRILARLARRQKRREKAPRGMWTPDPRPELAARLKTRLAELRDTRNADPRWKEALGWADEQVGARKQVRRRRAKDPNKVKRRKGESDEAFAKRFATLTTDETDEHFAEKLAKAPRRTRREERRAAIYQERRCYWGTWNALLRSVDQARQAVLAQRKRGMPAEWRRPRFGDPSSLSADAGGFRIVERGRLWWTVELRIGTGTGKEAEWVRVKAKCGNWHHVPDDARITTAKLTRRRDGQRWTYSLSLTVDGVDKRDSFARSGRVAFDWGHREHGHDSASDGLRAFVWLGDDGRKGEVLLPAECRAALDEIDALKRRLDTAWNARKEAHGLPNRTRHGYRRRLQRLGVRTEEEANWLRWETRHERRIAKRRKRVANHRKETYLRAVRWLRQQYAEFVFEGESNASIKRQQKNEQARRRSRANRDLTARYEFVSICERLGATMITVSARNTTKECPECGHLDENTAELLMVCSGCGSARDKDHGAAKVILRRSHEPLAKEAAE